MSVISTSFRAPPKMFIVCHSFRRIIRLTSPNLNYFILLGALLLYMGMYANVGLTTSFDLVTVQCHVRYIILLSIDLSNYLLLHVILSQFQTWLVFLGYALVLGTVIAKLWRVYHIFHNPTPAKKVTAFQIFHGVNAWINITSISAYP